MKGGALAVDGKVNIEGTLNGGKLLAGIWCGGHFCTERGRGRIFVSDSNGLHGALQGVPVIADQKGVKFP